MKVKWLLALAVMLALVWVGVATAGPRNPAGGDPDIWERAKPSVGFSVRSVTTTNVKSVVVDLVVFKAQVAQQVAKSSSTVKGKGLPSVSRPILGRR